MKLIHSQFNLVNNLTLVLSIRKYTLISLVFVNYCTTNGEVRGTMIVSSMCIIFQPSPKFIKKDANRSDRGNSKILRGRN